MRYLLFVLLIIVTVSFETGASSGIYFGLIFALLINFLFSRTHGYIFLAIQLFLASSARLDPSIGLLVLGGLVLLKFTEVITFHFSRSRDSVTRYLAGLVIFLTGYQLLLHPQFWQSHLSFIDRVLLNAFIGFVIFLIVKPFYRWLSPQQFEVLAK